MEINTKGLYKMDITETPTKTGKVTPRAAPKEHTWSYKMIYNSGIDGGWEKLRDDEAWEHMYLLPSQNKYFIVDLSSKAKRELAETEGGIAQLSTTLTVQSYRRFWNKAPYDTMRYEHEVFNAFRTNNYFCDHFMDLIHDPAFAPLAKMGLATVSDLNLGRWYFSLENKELVASGDVKENIKLFKYVVDKAVEQGMSRDTVLTDIKNDYRYDRVNKSILQFFQACRGIYGIDTTKRWFVDKWMEDNELNGAEGSMCKLFGSAGGTDATEVNYNGDIEQAAHDGYNVFDAETLSNYLFVKCKKQGKRKNVGSFVQLLRDCYRFQKKLYGKIRVKYPDYLATYHDKLEDDVRVLEEAGCTTEQYEPKAAQAKKYEGEYGEYKLIVLETAADVIDEARLQGGTCVASYVKKVAEGDDYILSLRKKKDMEKPVCTLEINNNRPVQFLGYLNRTASAEEWDALYHIMLNYYKKANLNGLYSETMKLIEKNKPKLEEERRNKPKAVQAEL